MGTPYERDEYGYGLAFSVSAQLYDWAFDNFSVAPALDVDKPLQEVAVKYSDKVDTMLLYPEEPFATLLPNEADETALQKTFILPESVAAPIHEGDVIGAVRLSLAGEELGTVGWSATARSSAASYYTTSNCSSALSAGCTFAPSLCCWRCWSSSTPF